MYTTCSQIKAFSFWSPSWIYHECWKKREREIELWEERISNSTHAPVNEGQTWPLRVCSVSEWRTNTRSLPHTCLHLGASQSLRKGTTSPECFHIINGDTHMYTFILDTVQSRNIAWSILLHQTYSEKPVQNVTWADLTQNQNKRIINWI